jgi:hypothetical protein
MQTGRFRTGSSSVGFSSTDSPKILLPSSQPCFFLRLDFLPFFCSGFRYWFLFILELMKSPQPRRKCLHCKELFLPDYRGGQRQCYCLKPDCRKARKRELMRAWLAKPENQDYFRDDQNAQRARDWQKDHPGYWKNTARCRRRTLQDGCSEQAPAAQEVAKNAPDCTLQDLCSMQVPLFVWLISMLVGSNLPDDIASSTRRLVIKGHDILGMVPGMNLERLLHENAF